MVKHMALLKFSPETTEEEIDRIYKSLAELKQAIPGMLDFAGGPYDSPEGLNQGFTHGFVMTFDTAESRDSYLAHPDHEEAKRLIFPHLVGGLEGVVAFDFFV